jgi:hypothetical protein
VHLGEGAEEKEGKENRKKVATNKNQERAKEKEEIRQ